MAAASIDSTPITGSVSADPALVAATAPSSSASAPIVTPAAAAASPLTSLLSPFVTSFLPVAKAKNTIDAIDIFLSAHPWVAPATYAVLTWMLQNGIGTAHTTRGGTFVPGVAPHSVKMLALAVFAGTLLGIKAVHTGGLGFIPEGLTFLLGGTSNGLAGMLPAISRFYYLSYVSYPLIAAAVIMLLPNTAPVNSALISSAIMLAPLGYAILKKLMTAPAAATPATSVAAPAATTTATTS